MKDYLYSIEAGETTLKGTVRANSEADARNWALDAEGLPRDSDVTVEVEPQ